MLKRDVHWHRRHEKKLLKDKRRHNRDRRDNLSSSNATNSILKKIDKERKDKLKTSWSKRLWLKFITTKIGVWVEKAICKHQENKYKG